METISKVKSATELLLSATYRNVKMESESIVSLLPKVCDKFLAREMTNNLRVYMDLSKSIEDMMHERGIDPVPPGALSKIGSRAGAFINTIMNSGTSHIARLCVSEARSSAQRLEKVCEELSFLCDARAVGICRTVIEKERQSCEKMEVFI